ncbi:hypothetical protein DFA_03767 [Cavenderia fasciculata]|uniref:F-box domain-containing protein n=1 Tax=Cavenderia fasciculata TaxID=261658 RepID=F4Q0C3_CACFS|nr:uncharacterized protein DFA_03767 [Cavenderia fasciculata]EGG18274.1 hypothetical protein DFA_03767 [Cavenderia fasciculata]|eukprot:XP_004357097.1 hypothetical protein DFA_03767 [Cavenderia fasciculata]
MVPKISNFKHNFILNRKGSSDSNKDSLIFEDIQSFLAGEKNNNEDSFNFVIGAEKKVNLSTLINISNVCKRWRDITKSMISTRQTEVGLTLNPGTHNIQDFIKHINHPFCLFQHIRYFQMPLVAPNQTIYQSNIEYIDSNLETIGTGLESINFNRGGLTVYNRLVDNLLSTPHSHLLPHLKRVQQIDYRKGINPKIFGQLEELKIAFGEPINHNDIYKVLGHCQRAKILDVRITTENSRLVILDKLFSSIPRSVEKLTLHVEPKVPYPYHLLPHTLKQLVLINKRQENSDGYYKYLATSQINSAMFSDQNWSRLFGALPLTRLTTISLGLVFPIEMQDIGQFAPLLPSTVENLSIRFYSPQLFPILKRLLFENDLSNLKVLKLEATASVNVYMNLSNIIEMVSDFLKIGKSPNIQELVLSSYFGEMIKVDEIGQLELNLLNLIANSQSIKLFQIQGAPLFRTPLTITDYPIGQILVNTYNSMNINSPLISIPNGIEYLIINKNN